MSVSESRRTVFVGKKRVYQMQRPGKAMPYGLKLPGNKWQWYATIAGSERALDRYAKDQPKGTRVYNTGEKTASIICACGCGWSGDVTYKTRVPRFFSDACRNRFNLKKREDARAARMKKLLGEQRKRRLAEKALAKASEADLVQKGGGKGVVKGDIPGSGVAPLMSSNPRGLFAGQPEPERTKKRSRVGLP